VDHEVEDDVDIERAGRKDAEAVDFKKHGAGEEREGGADGGIEALEMTGLGDALALGGDAEEFIGFGERGGDGLFDEDVNAGFHEGAGDRQVEDGGHGDGRGLDFAVSGQELGDGAEGFAVELAGNGVGAGCIGIDDADQTDAAGLMELTIDAGVIASEGADADDGDVDGVWLAWRLLGQGIAPKVRITSYCRSFEGLGESEKLRAGAVLTIV
jgi:hypothetical protein